MPILLLNPSPDCKVIYKGTKIATVEEVNEKPHMTVLAMPPEEKKVSPTKQQVLSKMVEKCASDLTVEQKEQLFQLLLEYANIFSEDGELGCTNRITHSINTGSAQPIR